jgi:uncharacterized protein (TIGR00730 family)
MTPPMKSAPRPGVCVFCGSMPGSDPRYADAAELLGAQLADGGFDVIYGGSADGCMGAVAAGALARGGRVVGVAPPFLASVEHRHAGLTRFETVRDLAERKMRMLSLSAAVLVMPGGTGTLDEFLEVLTLKRLALVRHPLVVLDIGGFFQPFDALLRHLVDTGFAEPEQRALYCMAAEPAAAMRLLATALAG